jgi:hypothetical protein
MPEPKGAQYVHTFPEPPDEVFGAVLVVDGRLFRVGYETGAGGGTRGAYVSLSRASATTSDHVRVVP